MNELTQQAGEAFVRKWLCVNNPTLVPILLADYHRYAIRSQEPVLYSQWFLDFIGQNPYFRGRPSTREGRQRVRKIREYEKANPSLTRIDLASLWRIAEVWVRVRHGLEKSLKDYVAHAEVRAHGDDVGDIDNRYRNWKRELKLLDRALQRTDLPQLPLLLFETAAGNVL
ncbi:hypothetical protein ACFLX9_02045 [Chloroflexota bacterium]